MSSSFLRRRENALLCCLFGDMTAIFMSGALLFIAAKHAFLNLVAQAFGRHGTRSNPGCPHSGDQPENRQVTYFVTRAVTHAGLDEADAILRFIRTFHKVICHAAGIRSSSSPHWLRWRCGYLPFRIFPASHQFVWLNRHCCWIAGHWPLQFTAACRAAQRVTSCTVLNR